jgi:hypothetical protein
MQAWGCQARLEAAAAGSTDAPAAFQLLEARGRGHMVSMRTITTLSLTFAVGCGGSIAGSPQDGGGQLDALSDGGFAVDSGSVNDAGTANDSATADVRPVDSGPTCALGDDGNWHCGNLVIQPCPPGTDLEAGALCAGLPLSNDDCFSCASDGIGDHWICVGVAPKEAYWGTPVPYSCSP